MNHTEYQRKSRQDKRNSAKKEFKQFQCDECGREMYLEPATGKGIKKLNCPFKCFGRMIQR